MTKLTVIAMWGVVALMLSGAWWAYQITAKILPWELHAMIFFAFIVTGVCMGGLATVTKYLWNWKETKGGRQ